VRPEILTLILLNYMPCALQHSDADVFETLLCFYTGTLKKLMNVEEGDDKRDFITGMMYLDMHIIHLLDRLMQNNIIAEFLHLIEMLPSNLSVLQRIVHSILRHHLVSIGGIFSRTPFMRCEATIERVEINLDEYEFYVWTLVSTTGGAVHPETHHMWHPQIYNFGLLVRMLHLLTIVPVLTDDVEKEEAASSSSTTSLTVQHTAPNSSEIVRLEEQLGELMRTMLLNDRVAHLKMLRIHASCVDVRHHAFIIDSCPTVFRVLCDVPGAWEHLLGQERDARRIGILEPAFLASTSRAARSDMARSHNFACNVPQVLVDAAVQQDPEMVLYMIANWRKLSRDNEMLSGGALLQYATTMHLAGNISSERLLELARQIPELEYPVHSEVLSLCTIMVRDGWQRNVARELYSVIREWVKKTELARIFVDRFFNDPDPFSFPYNTSLVEWSAITSQHEENDTENRSLLNAASLCRQIHLSRDADGALPRIGNLLLMITTSTISGTVSLLQRQDEVTREKRELLAGHMWLILLRCNADQISRLYATSVNVPQDAISHLLKFEQRLLNCKAEALRERLTPYIPAARAVTSWIIENVRDVYITGNKRQWNCILKLLLDADPGTEWQSFDDATVATFLHRVLPQRSNPVNLECERLHDNPVTCMMLRERGWLHDYSTSKSKRRVKFNWKSLNFWGHFTQAVLSDRYSTARLYTQNGGGQDVGGLTKDLYSRLGAEITEHFFERRGGYLIIRNDVSLHECIFIGRFLSRAIYIDGARTDMDLHPAMLYTICLQSPNSMYLLGSSDEVLRMFLVPREYPDWFRDACGNMPQSDGEPLQKFIPRVISELCEDRIDQMLTIANAFHDAPMSPSCPNPTPLFIWNAIRRPSVDIDGLIDLIEFELNGQGGFNMINVIRDYGSALRQALGLITQNQFLILCRMWCGSSRPSDDDKLKAQIFNRDTHYITARTCFNTIEIPHRAYSNVDDLATHLQTLIEFTTDQQYEYERAGLAFQMI
jgi:hypothetical protein